MATILLVFGLLGAIALLLIVTLLRRSNSPTQHVEGLRIEQSRREQARSDRASYSALAARNVPYTRR
ncbi:hypothetical protein AB0Q95_34945 [Streptomyces sp. NPDC059900]|uniref:hypothetical protein n=1 Tax=Streptomyces sp. NPDC059900 TaxID=3155816 RepID=UPI003440E4F3